MPTTLHSHLCLVSPEMAPASPVSSYPGLLVLWRAWFIVQFILVMAATMAPLLSESPPAPGAVPLGHVQVTVEFKKEFSCPGLSRRMWAIVRCTLDPLEQRLLTQPASGTSAFLDRWT